jgi:hypothetical protein
MQAVLLCQKLMRGYRARNLAKELLKIRTLILLFKKRGAMAIIRQSLLKWALRRRLNRLNAAILLQGFTRSSLAKKDLHRRKKQKKRESESAVCMQRATRGMQGRRWYQVARSERDLMLAAKFARRMGEAAELIQRTYRGATGRKRMRDMRTKRMVECMDKEQHLSAVIIQRVYRGKKVRRLNVKSPKATEDIDDIPTSPSFTHVASSSRPPLVASIGYSVKVKCIHEGAASDDVYAGVVIAANVKKGTVIVEYEVDDGESDYEEMSYESPNLVSWAPMSSVKMRPPIAECVGYRVLIKGKHEGAEEDDVYAGVVMSVNTQVGTLMIEYEVDDGETDSEELPYLSPSILNWIAAFKPQDGCRPPLEACVGCRVEVRCAEDNNNEDNVFDGVVIAVNTKKGTVMVEYKVEEGEVDREELPYESRSILSWERVSTTASSSRPPLAASIGYSVKVKCIHEGAASDDVYAGVVIAANVKKGTVIVEYEVDDGESDYEEMSYESPNLVSWAPVGTGAMHCFVETRKPLLQNSLGWRLFLGEELSDDMLAVVTAFDELVKTVTVRFEVDAEVETLPYASPDLTWVHLR